MVYERTVPTTRFHPASNRPLGPTRSESSMLIWDENTKFFGEVSVSDKDYPLDDPNEWIVDDEEPSGGDAGDEDS